MSDDTCDWCLRPLAPEEWESATTDEQRDGYCWGPGDALCDEIHGEEWERLQSVRPATPADDTCDTCGRPLATESDEQTTAPGEGEGLCWREYQGGVCMGEPVDWRRLYLVEADARAAAEGACDCAESEVARLRGMLGEAIEGLQEFVCDDEQGCCPASPCEIETKPHCRLAGLLGRLAAAPEEAWKRVERLVEEYEQSEQERLGELLTGIRDDLARIEARVDRTEELVERLLRALGEEVTP